MYFTSLRAQVIARFINEDASVLLFLLDQEGAICSTNNYTQQLLGEDVEGLLFREVLVDFRGVFKLKEHQNKKQPSLFTINIPGELPRSYLFTFHVVGDKILAFGQSDMEELEQLRMELLDANRELSNLTRELHKKNAQLAHLNKIKNQFLGMAAHDLRKPISVIMNYSEFLLDETEEQLEKEHRGFLEKVERSASFMKRMVDDFLDVSVIESGHFSLNLTRANLEDVLENSLNLARIQADKKGVTIQLDIGFNLPEVMIDCDKIEQVMSNLLGNGIEHSVAGSEIKVRLFEEGKNLMFAVEDCGAGMEEEDMKKLFQPFQKSSTVKTGAEKSTGLGLTITQKIVEAHHGEIQVDSSIGHGTTFTVALPKERGNE